MKSSQIWRSMLSTSSSSCSFGSTSLTSSCSLFLSRTSLDSNTGLFAAIIGLFIAIEVTGPLFIIIGGGVGAETCIGEGVLPGIPLILYSLSWTFDNSLVIIVIRIKSKFTRSTLSFILKNENKQTLLGNRWTRKIVSSTDIYNQTVAVNSNQFILLPLDDSSVGVRDLKEYLVNNR